MEQLRKLGETVLIYYLIFILNKRSLLLVLIVEHIERGWNEATILELHLIEFVTPLI